MYYKYMTVNELVNKARGQRQRDGGKTAAQQANIGPAVHPTPTQQPSGSPSNTHPAAIRQPIRPPRRKRSLVFPAKIRIFA